MHFSVQNHNDDTAYPSSIGFLPNHVERLAGRPCQGVMRREQTAASRCDLPDARQEGSRNA